MRYLMLFLTTLIFASCTSLPRNPASDGRRIVILIHGIGSDTEKTFGPMANYLSARQGYEVLTFNYDTKNDSKNVFNFAKDLAQFLRHYFQTRPIREGDEISFVMHSQGGLVGFMWLENSFNGSPDYAPELSKYVKRFLTLGTPMWGSKMARAGDKVNDALHIKLGGLAGNQQLIDMSYGSELFHMRRRYLFSEERADLRRKINSQVQFLHVAGWAKGFKPLGLMTDGIGYESDTTVPIASTRYELIYAISNLRDYPANHVLASSAFRLSDTHPYRLIEGWHVPGVLRNAGVGIAYTPEACVESACDHQPTLIVENFLNDRPIPAETRMESDLTGFIVELRVELPASSTLTKSDVEISFEAPRSKLTTLLKDDALSINDPFEIMSSSARRVIEQGETREHVLRYYFTGVSKSKNGTNPTKTVRAKISAKGMKTRFVDIQVCAGYTTYLELNLESF